MDRSLYSRRALINAKHRYDGHEADDPADISLREQLKILEEEVKFLKGRLDQKVASGKMTHPGWATAHKRKLSAIVTSFRIFVEAVETEATSGGTNATPDS
jgi:hypothetical protein